MLGESSAIRLAKRLTDGEADHTPSNHRIRLGQADQHSPRDASSTLFVYGSDKNDRVSPRLSSFQQQRYNRESPDLRAGQGNWRGYGMSAGLRVGGQQCKLTLES